jgi:uncharacterized protein (TIGR03083 family)
MKPVEPILTVELFPELHTHLMSLLTELSDEEWGRPTVCAPWSVKDLAAHLLGGDIGRLSAQRDKFSSPPPSKDLSDYNTLVNYINQLNHEWVTAAQRLSPKILIDLLNLAGPQLCQFFQTLDPHETAPISVAWAGEERPANWFDMAREYTEKWLHQQQIRDAVGRPGLTGRRYLYLVLDTFMRAMPYAYRQIEAAAGVSVAVSITGDAGGEWSLVREQEEWRLFYGLSAGAAAQVTLSQDTAWRLFTKGLSQEQARQRVQIEGKEVYGSGIISMVSIMA